MMYSTRNEAFALWCTKLVYSGVVFIPTFFYHFTVSFVNREKEKRKAIFFNYLSGVIFFILLHFTDLIINGVHEYFWGYQTNVNSSRIHDLFIILLILTFLLGFKELVIVFKHLQKGTKERNRLKYVLLSYIIAIVAALDFIPNYGIEFYPIGSVFIVSWISLLAYSIVKHQLMDITVAIKKTVAYSLVLLLLIVPCFAAVIATEKYLPQSFYYPVLAFLFVTVGFIFPRLKVQAERNLENVLFRGIFDYKETLDNLSKEMATLQDLDELLANATKTIARAIDTSAMGLYLFKENEKYQYQLKSSYGKFTEDWPQLDRYSDLVQCMRSGDDIIKPEKAVKKGDCHSSLVEKELYALNARISIPIKFERMLMGFMIIGEKESAGDYSKEELKVLSTMANQLAVAIENSLKYEEIKDLSVNLEKIVEERTIELRRANDELMQLDRLKNEFFSRVSHELRTPLANIVLPVENILMELGDQIHPENRKEKEAILRNARKLMKRINEILDLSKLEAGKMEVKASLRDIHNILEDIVFASSMAAKGMGIDLIFDPDPQLPNIYVDSEKMEKVFSNLISNALKFTNRGGYVRIKTSEEDHHIQVCVIDTGIGIEQNEIPHIFNRFHQADGSSSRKYEGTGLGLALVKELVDLHLGSVEVTSKLDEGTTFTVRLLKGKEHFSENEIVQNQESEQGEEFADRRGGERRKRRRRLEGRSDLRDENRQTIDSLQVQLADLAFGAENGEMITEEKTDFDEKKKRVLVVEDNRDLATNIAKILTKYYSLSVAYNGQQGLEKAQQEMPDLIISDIMMPLMDGHELCEKIKSHEKTQHIPVILLTAKAAVDDKIEGLKRGADQYLSKPFNHNELYAVVESLLTTRELQARLNKSNLELKKALYELEEAQVQLVHTARLESVGQLAAGMAHEIKNHIYCIRAGLGGIGKRLTLMSDGKLDTKETYEHLFKALKTSDNAIEGSLFIVNSLLDFSRKNREGMSLSDINQGVENTLTIVSPMIEDRITIHKEYGEIDQVECCIEEINQVVMNMVLNAHQAIEEKGTLWIKTVQNEHNVMISIVDDGPGIPQEHLDKIFTPFFSTKEKNVTRGLGLSISYKIIQSHHGTINVISTVGQGTAFTIVLPKRQARSYAEEHEVVIIG